MQRDFIGYGSQKPSFAWPNNARIAVNFVINYEEGSERNILEGDDEAETLFVDIPGIKTIRGKRHFSSESMFEYGSRCGIWRLLSLFDENNIPTTLFAVGQALERNPPLCEYLQSSKHEVAGHGYRWIDYRTVSVDEEKQHILNTIEIIETKANKKVSGWYTGRCSENTRKIITELGLLYDSQSYADDLPYWVHIEKKPLLIIPYTLDNNDIRYCSSPGWGSPDEAFNYLKYAFDCLYREGVHFPKIMTIALHPRISGRPARAEALRSFINYISTKEVWRCTRQDIAEFWRQSFPES